MRGKDGMVWDENDGWGITPAYAGKRPGSDTLLNLTRDHPRVCGEKDFEIHAVLAVSGSPPRMRGKVFCAHLCLMFQRITPAYAGKSKEWNEFSSIERDHPRVCGEKYLLQFLLAPLSGSPPRMRGKVFAFAHVNVYERITPAYAGKRFTASGTTSQSRDHPRVCGEKHWLLFRLLLLLGSPPRMRGKDTFPELLHVLVGITPAYAGKRVRMEVVASELRDHPRVCGEKTKKIP